MSAPSAPIQTTCPTCKAPASGKFCSGCGAPLAGASCAACHAALTPGAKFCHRCGLEVGAAAPASAATEERGFNAALPWAVAAIALVALVAMLAGQRFARHSTAAADAAAPAGLMGAPADAQAPPGARGAAAVDISSMSPEERAIRLYNRVMLLAQNGQADSVQLFAPMAIAAYQMLGQPNADQRYDMGRIGLVSGDNGLAAAEADTILTKQPKHLLGLILAADAARARNDPTRAGVYLRRFAAAEPAERARQLPEYVDHANDIRLALENVKKP